MIATISRYLFIGGAYMKKLIALLLLISTSCIGQIQQDKLLHLSGCYIVSATTTTLLLDRYPERKAARIGFAVGVGVGIAKEIYDIKYGTPSAGDLVADIIGAGLGAVVIRIRF